MNSTSDMTKSGLDQFLETSQHQRLFNQERLLVEVTELLATAMESQGISRTELAKRLGKTKAFVTQVLRGGHNMTLRTVADLFDAVDCSVVFDAVHRSSSRSVKVSSRWTFDTEPCWKHAGTVWEHSGVATNEPNASHKGIAAMGVAA
jgi:transcriptional regulator with XRE-family HTH domain